MADRFGRETWSLVVPSAWKAWHDDECATLVDSDESGALQIGAAFKDSDVTDQDLRDFAAEHLEAGAVPVDVQLGEFRGFEIGFATEERAWCQWYVRHEHQMLFITYNCNPSTESQHADVLDATLQSLRATGAAPTT